MRCGTLFILSSPSGAGKSSLLRALLQRHNTERRMCLSISHTTRSIRPGEKDGVDYHFVDKTQFEQMVGADEFYEWAQVFGACYGTHQKNIEQTLAKGIDVMLDIDWQGARQIRQQAQHVTSIFILPPSLQALKQRLELRAQDKPEVIAGRMQQAQSEISHYDEFDYVIVNDDFDRALQELCAIVYSQRLQISRQRQEQHDLIQNLMADDKTPSV